MPALIALIGSVVGSIVTAIGKTLSVETLKFVAWRALAMFLMFIAFPIVLYNVLTGMMFDFMDYALSYLDTSGLSSMTVELTGMGAYIATKIKLVEAISTYLSFVAIAFVMRFIPFFK